jgi:hypothetical protein
MDQFTRSARIVEMRWLLDDATLHEQYRRMYGKENADNICPHHAERRRFFEEAKAAARPRTYADVVESSSLRRRFSEEAKAAARPRTYADVVDVARL